MVALARDEPSAHRSRKQPGEVGRLVPKPVGNLYGDERSHGGDLSERARAQADAASEDACAWQARRGRHAHAASRGVVPRLRVPGTSRQTAGCAAVKRASASLPRATQHMPRGEPDADEPGRLDGAHRPAPVARLTCCGSLRNGFPRGGFPCSGLRLKRSFLLDMNEPPRGNRSYRRISDMHGLKIDR